MALRLVFLPMKNFLMADDTSKLFDNTDPQAVWDQATEMIRLISPHYDFTLVQKVYKDVLRMFYGEFPGYSPIKTLYHDLPHTLEVFTCGVRLMHGVHASGDCLSDEELTLMMLAILMHDIGYAQRHGENTGTGAQFTRTHVSRGVEFMQTYFGERLLPSSILVDVKGMILGTEHFRPFAQIEFPSERTRKLACIVATADIVGQMADRKYLEKLAFLYMEFQEAQFGSYLSLFDMLRQTINFYLATQEKLNGVLGGIYHKLEFHFEAVHGVRKNLYIESIEKNMNYLTQVVGENEANLLVLLKRNGILASSRLL
jgi:hypothetical protein